MSNDFLFTLVPKMDVNNMGSSVSVKKEDESKEKKDSGNLLDRLFLGAVEVAESKEWTTKNNIGAIISLCPMTSKPQVEEWKHFEVDDHPDEKRLYQNFEALTFWLHSKLTDKKNVLVHCLAGISRSPTLVAAYLIRYHEFSADAALAYIRQRRDISPNSGFVKHLALYEAEIRQQDMLLESIQYLC